MSHDAPPALVFPAPPLTVGQQYSAPNGVTYTWDGQCWTSGISAAVNPMWLDTGRDAYTPVHEPRSLFLASGTAVAFGDPETSPCPCVRGDGDHLRLTGIGDIQCYAGGGADPVATIDAAGLHTPVGGDLEGMLPNPRLRAGLLPVVPDALPPRGPAGGDLSGSSYPSPTIAPGAITTDKLTGGAVTAAKLAAGATVPGAVDVARLDPLLLNDQEQLIAEWQLGCLGQRPLLVLVAVAVSIEYLRDGSYVLMLKLRQGGAAGLPTGTLVREMPLTFKRYKNQFIRFDHMIIYRQQSSPGTMRFALTGQGVQFSEALPLLPENTMPTPVAITDAVKTTIRSVTGTTMEWA